MRIRDDLVKTSRVRFLPLLDCNDSALQDLLDILVCSNAYLTFARCGVCGRLYKKGYQCIHCGDVRSNDRALTMEINISDDLPEVSEDNINEPISDEQTFPQVETELSEKQKVDIRNFITNCMNSRVTDCSFHVNCSNYPVVIIRGRVDGIAFLSKIQNFIDSLMISDYKIRVDNVNRGKDILSSRTSDSPTVLLSSYTSYRLEFTRKSPPVTKKCRNILTSVL